MTDILRSPLGVHSRGGLVRFLLKCGRADSLVRTFERDTMATAITTLVRNIEVPVAEFNCEVAVRVWVGVYILCFAAPKFGCAICVTIVNAAKFLGFGILSLV